MNSNIGMYRIQISGNDYVPNLEAGMHYQLPVSYTHLTLPTSDLV